VAGQEEKPRLVELFEQAAAVMGLDVGQVLLELRFEDGKQAGDVVDAPAAAQAGRPGRVQPLRP